jgi:hypothetical protein
VKDAAQKFRSDAGRGFGQLPEADEAGEYSSAGYGRSDMPAIQVPLPSATAEDVTVPGVDLQAAGHRSATDRAFADGMSRRGSPEPVLPTLPDLPGVPDPLPFTPPAGVPTMVGHGFAGNSFDSHLFAALPWQDSDFGLTRGGVAAVSDAATFGRPGTQPGVAPD